MSTAYSTVNDPQEQDPAWIHYLEPEDALDLPGQCQIVDMQHAFWFSVDNVFIDEYAVKAGPSATLVYLVMKRLARSDTQQLWYSTTELEKKTGLSPSTFRRAVKKLESLGLLTIERRKIKQHVNLTNRYTLAELGTWTPKPIPKMSNLTKGVGQKLTQVGPKTAPDQDSMIKNRIKYTEAMPPVEIEKPKETPVKAPRKPNEALEAMLGIWFGIKSDDALKRKGHYSLAQKILTAFSETIGRKATPADIRSFQAWWTAKYPNADAIRQVPTVEARVSEWKSQAAEHEEVIYVAEHPEPDVIAIMPPRRFGGTR